MFAGTPIPRRTPVPVEAVQAFEDIVQSLTFTGWLQDHEETEALWETQKQAGQGDAAAHAQRVFYHDQGELASGLGTVPEWRNKDNQPYTPRQRADKRQKMIKKRREERDQKPTRETARLESQRPDLDSLLAIFHDGLDNAEQDQTLPRFTGGVPAHINGFESSTFQLRPHQREALGFLKHALEKYKFALLGGDMGVGKTAVIVALMVLLKAEETLRGGNTRFLITVTKPLLRNWQNELQQARDLSVCTFHAELGQRFAAEELVNYDVILTTYDTLMNQWKNLKLRETAFTYTKDGHKVLWEMIARDDLDKWNNETSEAKAAPGDYEQLVWERADAPLYVPSYTAVIGDEAHNFRNPASLRAQALSDVRSEHRVAVTGTPMQNQLQDMSTLFRYLRVPGYSNQEFFKHAFIEKPKKGKSQEKKRMRKYSMLSLNCVMWSFTMRRLHSDEFEGMPVTTLKHPRDREHGIDLAWRTKPRSSRRETCGTSQRSG